MSEERRDAGAGVRRVEDKPAKIRQEQLRHVAARNGKAIAEPGEADRAGHGLVPSRKFAASWRRACSGGGTYRPSSSTRARNSSTGAPVEKLSRKSCSPALSGGVPCT